MDKKVVKDMFPDWAMVMKQDRLSMEGYDYSSQQVPNVFDNDDNSASDESDMEHESLSPNRPRDESPRWQPSIPPLAMMNMAAHMTQPGETRAAALNSTERTEVETVTRTHLQRPNTTATHRDPRSVHPHIRTLQTRLSVTITDSDYHQTILVMICK